MKRITMPLLAAVLAASLLATVRARWVSLHKRRERALGRVRLRMRRASALPHCIVRARTPLLAHAVVARAAATARARSTAATHARRWFRSTRRGVWPPVSPPLGGT
jgi:hypothetical protein